VVLACSLLSAGVGSFLIGSAIIGQAQEKVRLDLNTAHEMYRQEGENLRARIRLTAQMRDISFALGPGNGKPLRQLMTRTLAAETIDLLTVVDNDKAVLLRAHNPGVFGDTIRQPAMLQLLSSSEAVVSTAVLSGEEMRLEGENLAGRARIRLLFTPKARKRPDTLETAGMMLLAAAPVLSAEGRPLGAIIGGILLNNDERIVDRVKEIVYQGKSHRGRDVGTTTIFLDDCRISTNVLLEDGSRALGTRASEQVYRQVMERGQIWADRAFVVNDWYRAAYEPIIGLGGRPIGMIYVGMLEAPYRDLRAKIVLYFLGIALAAFALLMLFAGLFAGSITRPMVVLLGAMERVAGGDLSARVENSSGDETGRLSREFNRMTEELRKATEEYQSLNRTLEDKIRKKTTELQAAQANLMQSEKLAALGKLAAGIAHEINNPLTSILLNSHLLKESLGRDDEELDMIIEETTRCGAIVRGLLEFGRQSPPEMRPTDLNRIIDKTLPLVESQAMAQGVRMVVSLEPKLPRLMADGNKMKQLLTNLILNALEAMSDGGTLSIATGRTAAGEAAVEVADTGCGISRESLPRIFDPFFTTKGAKGTGLGLAISYGIAQQHGGRIEVLSQVGQGTKFTIYLPMEKTNETERAQ